MGKSIKLHDLRIYAHQCDNCKRYHTEGWTLSELNAHACSDTCAWAIYKKNGQGIEEFEYDKRYDLAVWGITIF